MGLHYTERVVLEEGRDIMFFPEEKNFETLRKRLQEGEVAVAIYKGMFSRIPRATLVFNEPQFKDVERYAIEDLGARAVSYFALPEARAKEIFGVEYKWRSGSKEEGT